MNNKPRGLFGERPPQHSRWIQRCGVAAPGATLFCLVLEPWQRWQVLDRSCRTLIVSTMRWPKRSTLHVARYRLTPNRRLLRSRITTTELLPILGIFPDGV